MSTEVAHLKERRSGLEDEALLAMEAAEAAAGAVVSASAGVAGAQAEVSRLEAELAAAESEIDDLLAQERSQRGEAVSEVPAELLAAYETLRAKLGGVGAARLVGDTCSGCHLSLPSGEIERLRREPPDMICYCDNCQRILVR
jgi:predicted  nucleic acid-binding Zn-ribbon protein